MSSNWKSLRMRVTMLWVPVIWVLSSLCSGYSILLGWLGPGALSLPDWVNRSFLCENIVGRVDLGDDRVGTRYLWSCPLVDVSDQPRRVKDLWCSRWVKDWRCRSSFDRPEEFRRVSVLWVTLGFLDRVWLTRMRGWWVFCPRRELKRNLWSFLCWCLGGVSVPPPKIVFGGCFQAVG